MVMYVCNIKLRARVEEITRPLAKFFITYNKTCVSMLWLPKQGLQELSLRTV